MLALGAAAAALAGCANVILPPPDPPDPVPVVLVDYGYHSSLLLPHPDGGSWEYAYGEWNWFARNRDAWYNAFPALCWPTTGALGRRRLDVPARRDAVRGVLRAEDVLEFRVARSRAEALARSLDDRWEQARATSVHNPENGLTFVHDPQPYWCLLNCNHVMVRWLRDLGCGVWGAGCFSVFRVEGP
jgi:hypothetical protein